MQEAQEAQYVINVNTPEEVAYKLMRQIQQHNSREYGTEEKTLKLYAKCLKTVKGEATQ